MRGVGSGRVTVVPRAWWHAIDPAHAGVGEVSVVRRAGGDRLAQGTRPRDPGHRSGAGPVTVDDLPGTSPQRGTRSGRIEYRASIAQWKAELAARRPKTAKLVSNDQLRDYVQDRLAGAITRPDGKPVPGPEVRWIGRNKPRRQDRRWAKAWSPEQISNRLKVDFPDDESMRISHEAVY